MTKLLYIIYTQLYFSLYSEQSNWRCIGFYNVLFFCVCVIFIEKNCSTSKLLLDADLPVLNLGKVKNKTFSNFKNKQNQKIS